MNITFENIGHRVLRNVESGHYSNTTEQALNFANDEDLPISTQWAKGELLSNEIHRRGKTHNSINIVDIFCGSGGLSLGVSRALRALNLNPNFLFACDAEKDSLAVYKANFRPGLAVQENVMNLISGPAIQTSTKHYHHDYVLDDRLSSLEGDVDVFGAGPPCEGNSNLNNKTRRIDFRNELYIYAGLIAAKLRSKIIILENVPTVVRANQEVVSRTHDILAAAGYRVFSGDMVFASNDLLVGQTRRRHFLVAVKGASQDSEFPLRGVKFPTLTAWDVIGDLTSRTSSQELMLKPSEVSLDNQARINYLFDNDEFDLPDLERPDCHKLKAHNYKSVYGRMYADQPSPTITTGFQSPGRGRFIHPTERRGLTPLEGARIQGFPDSFRWNGIGLSLTKNSVTRLIGDAVPPNLGMFVTLAAIDLLPDGF